MKLKATVLVYLWLFFSTAVFAQDSWKFFSREIYDDIETFYYYDTASVNKAGDEFTVLVKLEYVPDMFNSRTQKYIDYNLETLKLNCVKNNYTVSDYAVYYNDKESEKIIDNKTSALIPKKHIEKLFTALCGARIILWGCARLYFSESYTSQEIGISERFRLNDFPDGITVMADLRGCDSSIGLKNVELRISRLDEMLSETVISSEIWDVQPDWRYIHFDNIIFPQRGLYKTAVLKPDGTEMIFGFVTLY